MRPTAFRPAFLLLALCGAWSANSPARADVINTLDATGTFQSGTTLSGTISIDETPSNGLLPYISAADLTTTGQNSYEFNNVVFSGNDGRGGTTIAISTQNQSARVSLDIPQPSSNLGTYSGGPISTNTPNTSYIFTNSPYPYGTADQLVSGSLNARIAGSACSADLKNSINLIIAPASNSDAFFGNRNAMTASFAPNGVTLTQAAKDCGVSGFDWKQVINDLPAPFPATHADGSVLTSPLDDPPAGGYSYIDKCSQTHLENNFPFYYSASGPASNCANVAAHETNDTTLNFIDTPSDACLPGIVTGSALAIRNMNCPDAQAPRGSEITFTTSLVGITEELDGSYIPMSLDSKLQNGPCIVNGPQSSSGCTWQWESDYNGTFGGVATLQTVSLDTSDSDDDGTGSVQLLSVGGVPLSVTEPPSISIVLAGVFALFILDKIKPDAQKN